VDAHGRTPVQLATRNNQHAIAAVIRTGSMLIIAQAAFNTAIEQARAQLAAP
jgi:hypothetical protein